ncbi:MAG TPA: hypothetical protein VMU94_02010 [Streptosporangiaceae bacterium]|nr:hypothetical protein [Streptosporangiaceae bacterium]
MSVSGREWIERLPAELDVQRVLLRGLLRECESQESIRWLVIACSLGRGAADRLSDLDLGMGVADEQFDAAILDIRRAVDRLGDLVDSYHHELPGLTMTHERIFAQYADRGQVDLVVIPASQSVGPIRDEVVLYDPDLRIAGAFEQGAVTAGQVREWAFGGWCALADMGKYLRRGSRWEALQRLTEAQGQLWRLWAAVYEVPNPQFGLTSLLDFAPGQIPPAMETTVSDLDHARLLAAGQSLARQLTEASELLQPDFPAALPLAMGRYVTDDLEALVASREPY